MIATSLEDWQARDEVHVEQIVAFLHVAGKSCTRRDLYSALWIPQDDGRV
jgi:thymidylate synthase